MRKTLALILGATTALILAGCSSGTASEPSATPTATSAAPNTTEVPTDSSATPSAGSTAITITIDDTTITATLNESAAAQDLVAALPMTIPSVRNIDIEYFGATAAPLTETGPFYEDVQPGDVVYYAPKDEVALIFELTSSPGQLTKIGDITSDLSIFDGLPDDADILYELG
ncbi:hypothetical protein IWX75_002906 [Arthrobacter sp. CAN_A6]|uniref:cyclophilin-like fold protein n=1 Tax=Arthrobacter sp. CAN_A6 TaxID=2787721 RepID=UPI0018C96F50